MSSDNESVIPRPGYVSADHLVRETTPLSRDDALDGVDQQSLTDMETLLVSRARLLRRLCAARQQGLPADLAPVNMRELVCLCGPRSRCPPVQSAGAGVSLPAVRHWRICRPPGAAEVRVHEVRVGFELTEPFHRSDEFYARCAGVPIVLIVRARK